METRHTPKVAQRLIDALDAIDPILQELQNRREGPVWALLRHVKPFPEAMSRLKRKLTPWPYGEMTAGTTQHTVVKSDLVTMIRELEVFPEAIANAKKRVGAIEMKRLDRDELISFLSVFDIPEGLATAVAAFRRDVQNLANHESLSLSSYSLVSQSHRALAPLLEAYAHEVETAARRVRPKIEELRKSLT